MAQLYAYAPGGTLDRKGSAKQIQQHIKNETGFGHPINKADVAALNSWEVFPVKYVGAPADETETQTGEVDDGIQGDGHWQVTRVFGEKSIEQAQREGRTAISRYYQSYLTSYFTVGGKTYSADAERAAQYLAIGAFIAEDSTVVNYFVTATDDTETAVDTLGKWSAFLRAWRGLFIDAQNHGRTAVIAVKAATTADEVKAALDAMPAIPVNPDEGV